MEIIGLLKLRKIKFYCQLMRCHNLLIGAAAVFVTAYLLQNNNYYLIFLCALEVMLVMALGNVINDIVDTNIDQINHPNRVLVQRQLSITDVSTFQKVLMGLIVLLTLQFHYMCIVIIFGMVLPLLYLYNYYFKNYFLVGNIIVAFLLGFVFVFSELALTRDINFSIMPFMLAFNLSLVREIIKDMQDYSGDLQHKIKTAPVILGINKTVQYLAVYIMLCLVLFILPYAYGFYGKLYLISLIFCIVIPLIYSVFLLLKFQTHSNFRRLSLLYKILSALGLIVILLSKG